MQAFWQGSMAAEIGFGLCGHFHGPDVHGCDRNYVMGSGDDWGPAGFAPSAVGDCTGAQFGLRAD